MGSSPLKTKMHVAQSTPPDVPPSLFELPIDPGPKPALAPGSSVDSRLMWASQRIAVLQADLAGAEAELKVPSSDRRVLIAVVLVVIVAEVPFSSEGRREEEGKEGRKESFLVTSFACLPNRRRHRI